MKNKNKTLLWEIHKEGSHNLYLFGTIHVQDARVLDDFPIIEQLLSHCERFAAESDLDELRKVASENALALPAGETLESLLGSAKYQKLGSLLKKSFGLSIDMFRDAHPMMLSQVIMSQYMVSDLPKTQDELLWELATEKGLSLTGVEKATRQLEIFNALDLQTATTFLKRTIKNWSATKKNVKVLLKAYLTKNPQHIFQISKRQIGKLRKPLIYQRNIEMANEIEKYADEMPTFVAIGAGHLGGKKGVLRLLKKKDFKVSPIKT